MFQAKCHLLDTANHGLPVIIKSWLEKKRFTKKQKKKKKLSIDWDKYWILQIFFCKKILEHVIEILNFNVGPIIEYASPVWDTNNKNVIQKVESVQRKAARFTLNEYNKYISVSKMIHY